MHRQPESGEGRIRTSEGIASRFTVCPIWPLWNLPLISKLSASYVSTRATSRNRTRDFLITSEALYRLSYGGNLVPLTEMSTQESVL